MFSARFRPLWRKTGSLALRQQVFFTDQQVAERSEQVKSIGGFSGSAIAGLTVTEELFNLPEWGLYKART